MTKIEWAALGLGKGETWNPIRARNTKTGAKGHHCEKVSPACDHCYAERQNKRGIGTGLPYKPGHRQNGDVEVYLDEAALLAPLRWKNPRGVFVCSMTDLFADFVTDDMRDRIFAVMALASQHRFALLTKRAGRMRAYMTDVYTPARIASDGLHEATIGYATRQALVFNATWPLRNVWLGVTAEDPLRGDERIPELLATPAAVRFVSVEPMLGPFDLTDIAWPTPMQERFAAGDDLSDSFDALRYVREGHARLDWVICGGESGPGARPMHPDWARSLRDQCAAAGVPFFFKQWGELVTPEQMTEATAHRVECADADAAHGDEPVRGGKARAGRLLDGREHNEFPAAP